MKRFAQSIPRQKGIKPPAGYSKSASICRAFLDQHAPKKGEEVDG
jgi:DNA topoisomerase-3